MLPIEEEIALVLLFGVIKVEIEDNLLEINDIPKVLSCSEVELHNSHVSFERIGYSSEAIIEEFIVYKKFWLRSGPRSSIPLLLEHRKGTIILKIGIHFAGEARKWVGNT